jgi:hypothetical protein
MPETEIVKLKIRRGLDEQRESVVLEQGELGYTTDKQRVWVGDGITQGGIVIGNKNYITANKLTLTNATKGDTAFENNRLYQLKGGSVSNVSSWEEIGPQIDENVLEYNTSGRITIKDGGIGRKFLGSSIVDNTGGINTSTEDGLSVRTDNNTIRIVNNSLQVGQIGTQNIKRNAIGNGLTGGEGDIIALDIDTNKFKFTSGKLDVKLSDGMTFESSGLAVNINQEHFKYNTTGQLELKSGNGIDIDSGGAKIVVNTDHFYFDNNALNIRSNLNGILDIGSINPVGFGDGLALVNNTLVTDISGVADDNTLTVEDNKVGLTSYLDPNNLPEVLAFDGAVFDKYGRFTETQELATPIAGTVKNAAGYIDHYSGNIGQTSYTDQSLVECSNDTGYVTLTSAGFIQVQVNVNGEEKTVSIPVFE